MRRSQSAVEFIVLASFMFLIVLSIFAVISSNVSQAKEEGNRKTAQDIAEFVYREVELARSVHNGYIRVFSIPQTVNGVDYSINITDNKKLIVDYLENEHVRFLPPNVSGNVTKGAIQIRKKDNIIYINSYLLPVECNDSGDNDDDGLLDLDDAGCTSPEDIDETNCGDLSCEGGESCSSCSQDCGACPLPGKFILRYGASNAALFAENGNVILRGILQQNSNPAPASGDEFIVRSGLGDVALVDLETGNMVIKGILHQNQQSLDPPQSDDFVLKNSNSAVVSYIDESGNFFIKGALTQNGDP